MIYIDDFNCPFRGMIMCHMIADSVEELHEMADKIGVQRKYFQSKSYPHYDIALSKKKIAVEHGAKAISCKELVLIIQKARRT
jgi:hypothetical protein